MGRRVLGLDIGVASIGATIVNLDENKIEHTWVHTFQEANALKSDATCEVRRQHRSSRRNIQRRAGRLANLRIFLADSFNILDEEIDNIYNIDSISDLYSLRVKALDNLITEKELFRILYYFGKKRGYSKLRSEKTGSENGIVLSAIATNTKAIENSGYRTVGEYLFHQDKETRTSFYITTEKVKDEIKFIFKRQRELGSTFATEKLEEDYYKIVFYRRGLKSIGDMVGYCGFEPAEKRAPKASYTFQVFNVLQKLVNSKLLNLKTLEERKLTKEEIEILLNKACELKSGVTFKQALKCLDLGDKITFVEAQDKKDINTVLVEMKKYHELKGIISKVIGVEISQEIMGDYVDEIAIILTYYKTEDVVEKAIETSEVLKDIPDKDLLVSELMECSCSTCGNISIKALKKIIPFLKEGYLYHEACAKAGYEFSKKAENKGHSLLPLPIAEEYKTMNPTVNRAQAKASQMINHIIKYLEATDEPMFDLIRIETANEIGLSTSQKKEVAFDNAKRNKEYTNISKKVESLTGKEPTKKEIRKYMLWKAQQGFDIYSPLTNGKATYISEKDAITPYTHVEHIVPESVSRASSQSNLCLATSQNNIKKGDKTFYEWLYEIYKGDEDKIVQHYAWLETLNLGAQRLRRLRIKHFTKDDVGFTSSNLNDTRWIAKQFKRFLEENLSIKGKPVKVECVKGAVTYKLREEWGLRKDRNESDRHHAQDAAIVACASAGIINKVCKIKKDHFFDRNYKQHEYFKELMPWETFAEDVKEKVDNVFVTRLPQTRKRGALHGETIYKKGSKHLGPEIRGGVTDNSSIWRLDVYSKIIKDKKRYRYIPVYMKDAYDGVIPKVCKSSKEIVEVDETWNKEFSLFKDSLIYVKTDKLEGYYYFKSFNVWKKSLMLLGQYSDKVETSLDSKVIKLEKIVIDILGCEK